MKTDLISKAMVLSKEEFDFYSWLDKSKIANIYFGQKVRYNYAYYFLVGGTLDGDLYLQAFPARTDISKLHLDKSRSYIRLHWTLFLSMISKK